MKETNEIKENEPTSLQKLSLVNDIENNLSKDDQLYIFFEILNKMNDTIYTQTQYKIMFDLNDLSPDVFWKLHNYVKLTIKNKERHLELDTNGYEKEHIQTINNLNSKILHDYNILKSKNLTYDEDLNSAKYSFF